MFVVFVTLMMLLLFSSVQVRAPVNNNTSTLQHCTVTHNTKDIKISWVKIPRLKMFHRHICFVKIHICVCYAMLDLMLESPVRRLWCLTLTLIRWNIAVVMDREEDGRHAVRLAALCQPPRGHHPLPAGGETQARWLEGEQTLHCQVLHRWG